MRKLCCAIGLALVIAALAVADRQVGLAIGLAATGIVMMFFAAH
tara:strand:- start:202 stop:333 length:132 start_codon:yes stop_codon:yes gene_type:complete